VGESRVPGREGSGGLERASSIRELALAIDAIELGHPVRVAVDGVGASGKTALADELAQELSRIGRSVIRSSIDGFHNPREIRYSRGRNSPEGYLNDSFDYDRLLWVLLHPLGPDGTLMYREAVFDFRTESRVDSGVRAAAPDSVLVFDGVFLLRPELIDAWDFSVFVDAGFDVTLARALVRDLALFGDEEAVREHYLLRYIPGESLYLDRYSPREKADAVVINNNPAAAELVWRSAR
jgi:uridine kinase